LPAGDAALAHAAMQTLRRSGNWPALLQLLDGASTEPLRAIALRAVSERTDLPLVDGLLQRLTAETAPARRRQYADALARVWRKPGPWAYWGFRPAPRPANSVAWARTDAIRQALEGVLADPDRATRLAVLRRMRRERIPVPLASVAPWLRDERQEECVGALLEALREQPAAQARSPLLAVVRDPSHPSANRLSA